LGYTALIPKLRNVEYEEAGNSIGKLSKATV